MKLMFRLAVLVCLSSAALHAAQFLVLIRSDSWNPMKYLRAELSGGQFLVADTNTYTGSDIRFIMEDIWTGTPWLETDEPFWIRAEINNMYWRAASDHQVRVDQSAPPSDGTGAFSLAYRLEYEGLTAIKPNWNYWYNYYLYGTRNFGFGVRFTYPNAAPSYTNLVMKFTILAVYE